MLQKRIQQTGKLVRDDARYDGIDAPGRDESARVELITKLLADEGYDCGLCAKLHIASAWNGVEERTDEAIGASGIVTTRGMLLVVGTSAWTGLKLRALT